MEDPLNNIFQIGQRKTFLKGTFYGKFRTIDKAGHILTPFESLNKLEIYDSQVLHVAIQSEEQGTFNILPDIQQFNLGLQNPVLVYFEKADGKGNFYHINLLEPVFTDIKLDEIVTEGKNSFGKIDGIIYGYILDEVKHPFSGELEEKVEENKVLERREFTSHTGEKYWGEWYVSKELPVEISVPTTNQSWHGGLLSLDDYFTTKSPNEINKTPPKKNKWLQILILILIAVALICLIAWQPKFVLVMFLILMGVLRLLR